VAVGAYVQRPARDSVQAATRSRTVYVLRPPYLSFYGVYFTGKQFCRSAFHLQSPFPAINGVALLVDGESYARLCEMFAWRRTCKLSGNTGKVQPSVVTLTTNGSAGCHATPVEQKY